MFFEYYKLDDHPFQEHIAPVAMLQDPRIAHGMQRLDYFVHSGTVGLLLGATGLGKSSLVRLLISRLTGNRYHPIHLHLSHLPSASLLRLIVSQLDEKPKIGKDRLFRQILQKTRSSERTTILIIDEAHLLDETALTDLRLLVSAASEEEAKLKLLLCGQEDLGRTLKRHSLADLVNRINVRCQLFALTPDQSADYIDHRLKRAGGTAKLIAAEAKQRLHEYADGVPRTINNLATVALIQGAAQKQDCITEDIVDQAAVELRLA